MQEKSDAQLLREYAKRGDEASFRELVTRHTDFIYSAALRQVNSSDLACDIAQSVFTDLARKARPLAEKIPVEGSLAGWLHRSARYAALNHLRDTRRRLSNERQAMEQLLTNSEFSPDWERIRPALDEALDSLGDEDREALLLRYFKNQDFRAVGLALSVSDDAAQKRVSRAVERLREFFAKRGVTTGATGLIFVISANAVQAAPVGLAATISTAAAITGVTIGTAATVNTAQAIAMTTLQKALLTATITVVAGTGFYASRQAMHWRAKANALEDHQAPLIGQLQQLRREREDGARQLVALRNDNERLNRNNAELFKLRGEVTGLRREASKANSLETDFAKLRRATDGQTPPGTSKLIIPNPYLAREAWSDKGTDSPYHAFETMLWAGMTGHTQRLAEVTIPGENSVLPKENPPLRTIKGIQIVTVDGQPKLKRVGAIVEDEFYGGGLDKPPGTVQLMRFWYLVQTNGEWKVTGENITW